MESVLLTEIYAELYNFIGFLCAPITKSYTKIGRGIKIMAARKKVVKKKVNPKTRAKQQRRQKMVEEQAVKTGSVGLLRKITNKTVLGKEFLEAKPKEPTDLYTLMGVINSYQPGQSEYGTFVKFKGDFVADVHVSGESYRAPNCIVPVPMDDVLATMYDKAVEEMVDKETGEMPPGKRPQVQFAVKIGYKPGDTPTGYEWTVTPLMEMQENDAITNLRQTLKALEKI